MRPISVLRLSAVLFSGWLLVGAAQAGEYRAPRTAFGHPDLQGAWTNMSLTRLERPAGAPLTFAARADEEAFEARMTDAWRRGQNGGLGQGASEWQQFFPMARIRGRLRTSWIVSPEDGRLPWRSDARRQWELLNREVAAGNATGPEARPPVDRCLLGGGASSGPPLLNPPVAGAKLILQTPSEVVIVTEMNHDARIVRLNGRHPPAHVRKWMGDSIGHWEGETLVVVTTNFHLQEGFRNAFMMSPDARVTERFTRLAPGELLYAFEVDDPAMFTQTWRAEMPFRREHGPFHEFACHEGNYSMTGILAGARRAEADLRAAE
jgi:hypothetical protein